MEGRAVLELGTYFMAYPFLRTAPRGDGHPVLVLPGLIASDTSTELLRAYLKDLGYSPHGWELTRVGPSGVTSRIINDNNTTAHAPRGG